MQESKNRLGKWERKQINQVVQEEKLMDITAAQYRWYYSNLNNLAVAGN